MTFQSSAKNHCNDYRALANEAYANMQAFLKSKGAKNVDEWLKTCEKELSPEDAASVQKVSSELPNQNPRESDAVSQALADLEPPQGLDALVQPTEIAKFIASWFIREFVCHGTLVKPHVFVSQRGYAHVSSRCFDSQRMVL